MTRPARFILRMVLFLVAALAVAVLLFGQIQQAFLHNPGLNGLILAVMLIGIGFIFRQVLQLGQAVGWLEAYQRAARSTSAPVPDAPSLVISMARMLESRKPNSPISAPALRSILDSTWSRLDESRDLSRYLIGLMVFLGLLGTFWGLLSTVSSVGEAIKALSLSGAGDPLQLFDGLKKGLEAPLSGMGTAFSSSLLGLAGSLVLGFLDLQAGAAQNRFYNELEEWLSGMTKVGASGAMIEGDQSVPAYVQALLEQTAEGLENLQRAMARAEENRAASNQAVFQLAEQLAVLTDSMRGQQDVLRRLADNGGQGDGFDGAARNHLRNIDVYVTRLLEETAVGRNRMIEEVRSEIKLLARTVAMVADSRRTGS